MSSTGALIWVDPGVRFNVNGRLISQPPTGGTSGSSVTKGGPAWAVPFRTNQATANFTGFLIRPPMEKQKSHAKAQRRKGKTGKPQMDGDLRGFLYGEKERLSLCGTGGCQKRG